MTKTFPLFLLRSCLLCTVALAAIQFTSPTSSSVLAGGSSVTIEWTSSGAFPLVEDVDTYTLSLCTGSNMEITFLGDLVADGVMVPTAANSGSSKVKALVPAEAGADGVRVYFLRMVSV